MSVSNPVQKHILVYIIGNSALFVKHNRTFRDISVMPLLRLRFPFAKLLYIVRIDAETHIRHCKQNFEQI